MTPAGVFETGDVRLTWNAGSRLVEMEFTRPGAFPTEEDAKACVARIESWARGDPVSFLVDCAHVRNTEAGWRAVFADFLKQRDYVDRIAWFNMNPLIRMMATMFLRATRAKARGFRVEKDARAWVLAEAPEVQG